MAHGVRPSGECRGFSDLAYDGDLHLGIGERLPASAGSILNIERSLARREPRVWVANPYLQCRAWGGRRGKSRFLKRQSSLPEPIQDVLMLLFDASAQGILVCVTGRKQVLIAGAAAVQDLALGKHNRINERMGQGRGPRSAHRSGRRPAAVCN